MVKDVMKIHKRHLGEGGGGGWVGVCMNVCVCVQGFILDFEFWDGGEGELQSSVLMLRGCIAHNN